MPIYEYECDKCENVMEKWHSINDSSPDKCECGGNLTKIISRTTFHLKGSGWYVTDYCKRNSNDKLNSTKTPAASDNSSKEVSNPASSPSDASTSSASQTSVAT